MVGASRTLSISSYDEHLCVDGVTSWGGLPPGPRAAAGRHTELDLEELAEKE